MNKFTATWPVWHVDLEEPLVTGIEFTVRSPAGYCKYEVAEVHESRRVWNEAADRHCWQSLATTRRVDVATEI